MDSYDTTTPIPTNTKQNPYRDMLISVITINRNNSAGLLQTIESVAMQTSNDFEYIIVDGASTDGSVDTIRQHASMENLKWISEPDTGIYNAMNKGIRMATGDYVLMLNSGDRFINPEVVTNLAAGLANKAYPDILYGNTINTWPDGKQQKVSNPNAVYTMMSFYLSTLDHVGTCIKRQLFDTVGMYNEQMKICSDWEWFMQAVVFKGIKPDYIDLDTVYFDMTGISESDGKNRQIMRDEKRKALQQALPPAILADYDKLGSDYRMLMRLRRHPWAYRLTKTIERILFKIEKSKK